MRLLTFLFLVLLSWGLSAKAYAFDAKAAEREWIESMNKKAKEDGLRVEKCTKDLKRLYPKIDLDVMYSVCNPYVSDDKIRKFYNPNFMTCYTIFYKSPLINHKFDHFFDCSDKKILEASQNQDLATVSLF